MSLRDFELAIFYLRLAHIAAHRDFWTTPLELYAYEAGPLWSPVSYV